jgi:hypothetical protein
MSEFWGGLLLGFLFGVVGNILVNHSWELMARFRTHATAKRLAGTWTAYNIDGRVVHPTPMEDTGPTVISAMPHWWSANSEVLQVSGRHGSGPLERRHSGTLVIAPYALGWRPGFSSMISRRRMKWSSSGSLLGRTSKGYMRFTFWRLPACPLTAAHTFCAKTEDDPLAGGKGMKSWLHPRCTNPASPPALPFPAPPETPPLRTSNENTVF